MKKRLLALVAACATLALSAVLLAGCSGGGDAQQSANTDNASGDGTFTLAVGFDQGYPPYGYVGDDGQFTGFDLDLAQAVCEKMGWELKLEAYRLGREGRAASAAAPSTASGTASPWRAARTATRSPSPTCSTSRWWSCDGRQRHRDARRPGRQGGHDAGRLRGARRAGERRPGRPGRARFATAGAPQTIGDYNNAFMQLESGMVDAVACDLSIAAYQMAANPGKPTCSWTSRCPPSTTPSASRRATPTWPSR